MDIPAAGSLEAKTKKEWIKERTNSWEAARSGAANGPELRCRALVQVQVPVCQLLYMSCLPLVLFLIHFPSVAPKDHCGKRYHRGLCYSLGWPRFILTEELGKILYSHRAFLPLGNSVIFTLKTSSPHHWTRLWLQILSWNELMTNMMLPHDFWSVCIAVMFSILIYGVIQLGNTQESKTVAVDAMFDTRLSRVLRRLGKRHWHVVWSPN